ncbi:MAG: AAA family ATPase [Clostridiales bacterium]|nr:AAA family ATPase [Clostridiales bacterium]
MANHLSIRIPWKDNGYDGLVCDNPCYNNACLRLANIALNRDDKRETEIAGCPMSGHEAELPCISEGGAFMSDVSHKKTTVHPYKKNNSASHGHFLETELVFPPFSLPARPFGWTMLSKSGEPNNGNIRRLSEMYNINYDENREPDLGFSTNWVQDATNQRAIFERFYQNVTAHKSLVIPYAKQVPFIEDAKRVVMGIGFVESLTPPPEHNHTNAGKLRSILWETMVGHTIRNERKNGFLLPYREMMAYAEEHPDFDMRSITVFADDAYFDEFSFATERLSYDAVISVLLQSIKALSIVKQCIPGNWDDCIAWANARLAEVWKDRGAFPGAGIMLYSMGFNAGILIAESVKDTLNNDESYIAKLEQTIAEPQKYLPPELADAVQPTLQKTFCDLKGERKSLFWLLSRFSLTLDQARALFNRGYDYLDYRGNKHYKEITLDCTDAEMLANPYIIYEKTRLLEQAYQVPYRNVDIAVFPPPEVQKADLLPEPTAVTDINDKRRIRALSVSVLERQTDYGHTVYPQNRLISEINELPLNPSCMVTSDILDSLLDYFKSEMIHVETKDNGVAYQLIRIHEFDEVIRRTVDKLIESEQINVSQDWSAIVNEAFKETALDEHEQKARTEKIAILGELAKSRLSVLVGGAGTGKTTLLALLCTAPQVQSGGVLLLAPTGKARVRMSQAMNNYGVTYAAKTVAQFLIKNHRFNYATMRYHLSKIPAENVPDTVIIDESSMLTEEMVGALLESLRNYAKRIIFVGDPNQLPPIGAGRPFVDLVNHLKIGASKSFPFVGKGYGKLTVTNRQRQREGQVRFDTLLAEWYGDTAEELDSDVFAKLQANECGGNIAFKTWETAEELENLVLETIAEEAVDESGKRYMHDVNDVDGFDFSLGGTVNGDWMNFGGNPQMIEDWQILSAYRNNPQFGTATINRIIHQKYRVEANTHSKYKKRSTKNILGTDGIVYGEKVINIRNQSLDGYPEDDCLNYVANGEVGIVERIWQKPRDKANTHQIRFSSQPKHNYNWRSAVSDEGNADLELAYALTVHKAQGSEFGKVILIIGEPCNLLSKELLYTAITRQKDKLVILYNAEAYNLRSYSSMEYSDIARRFTNLFEKPEIVEHNKKFYEANLIHKTIRGELVRSKSEVIIANMLFERGIHYEYEKELILDGDGIKVPDFTITVAGWDEPVYWEHCGMMSDTDYRRRWEAKRTVYEKHGIVEGKNLIVSEENDSFDSQKIAALIDQYDLGW